MKENWKVERLGELCNIELGRTPNRDNTSFWDPGKKTENVWLSIADLLNTDNNIVSDSKEYISDLAKENSKIVKAGTLLLSFKLTLGRMAFAGRDLYTNEAIAALTIKNESEIYKHYLFYYLTFFDWDKASEGDIKVKGKTLNKKKLYDIDILYPTSLAEQKRIVAILDKAFTAIDRAKEIAEKNLKNAKELFDSYLQSIFANPREHGWDIKTIGDIFETGAGGTPLKTHKEYYEGGTIPWLMSGEVAQGEIFHSKYFITKKGLENSSAKIFPQNTVLVAMYGATAGEVGLLRFEAATNQAICGIFPNEVMIPEFLYNCIVNKKAELVSMAVGNAQPNISQIKIKNTFVPIPPIEEQNRIVCSIDAVSVETNKLKSIYAQKLNHINELKKSILQKAFNGELETAQELKTL